MKTIFFKTLSSIIITLLVFIAVMLFIQIYGFNSSVKKWEEAKISGLKTTVDKIINDMFAEKNFNFTDLGNRFQYLATGTLSFSVYDNEKKIIYIIQKGGQMKQEIHGADKKIINSKYFPVIIHNNTVGYYMIHFLSYKSELENENFFLSLRKSFFLGLAVSFVFGLFSALIFSKTISFQSKKLASGIDEISHGNLNIIIPENGLKEISIIAKSANILKEKLKKEKELRDQWALDIAHDLRTPVTAVKTQLESVLDKALDLSDERIKKILLETEKIELLINELAELTNLESPELKLNPETVKTVKIFSEIENTFHQKLKEKTIDFSVNNNLDEIIVDKKLFMRALMNIVDNAVKFTPVKEKISINANSDGNLKIIEVKNSGTFISESDIKKIFDRMYRADFARNTKGFGLGLSIAKKIIELHGGKIQVESNKKTGTDFIISLKIS